MLAVVDSDGRSADLGPARGRGGSDGHRAGRGRCPRGSAGHARAAQPARVRDGVPRGAAGAGGRRTRQPAVDRRRAGPDDLRLRRAARGGRQLHGRAGGRRRRCAGAGARSAPWPSSATSPSTGSGRPRPRAIPPLQDPEKLAALLYTSGASGRPRAVMLTHRALLANLRQVAAVEPPLIHGDDVVLGVLPLFHVYGLNAVLGGVLQHQAKLVLAAAFDPVGTLELIDDQACSVVPVAPPVFAHWLPMDNLLERLGSVRLMLSGSAPLSDDLAAAFTERTGHRGAPGLRPDRGRPGRHQHPGQHRPAARVRRRSTARHRDRPGRRRRPRARGGGPGRDPDPRRQPVQRLLARRRPAAPTPRAGGPPATSGSSTRPATCSWSTGSRT